jgi:hypothetical protein
MSKKKLLKEAQVRRMFELAGIPAIGETFIGNKFSRFVDEAEEEDPLAGEEDPLAGEEDPLAGEEDPLAADVEAPLEDPGAAMGEIPQEKVEAIVDAVLAGIEQETGVPLERVPGNGDEAAAEVPVEEPIGGEEDPLAAAAGEEEMPDEDELALEEKRLVNEVARKVARRLIRQARKSK